MSVLILVWTLNMALTDFWWLTPEQANKYVYVELVYHQPLTDEDDAPHQDFNNPCFTQIQSISKWCNKYQNTNVYRSLKIWSDSSKREALSGPFVIDVDNERKNLDDALIVTREAVKCIFNSYNLKESELRLFFTGHKGFNIEVLPSALGLVGTQSEQDNKADCIRKKIISELQRNAGLVSKSVQCKNLVSEQGTIVDPIHNHVRLHDSINKWIEDGEQKAFTKIGLTPSELNNLPLKQIVAKSIV